MRAHLIASILAEKQDSDAEEEGGLASQEEEGRKPKAEVIGVCGIGWEWLRVVSRAGVLKL